MTGEDVLVEEWAAADAARGAAVAHLFDDLLDDRAFRAFLEDDRHHLLIASIGGAPAGMLTAVELLHPDKARPEMFVYEVGVDDAFRRRGVASALLRALRDLAVTRGCGEQWVLTDEANAAALATYGRAGGAALHDQVLFTWHLTDPEAEDRGHDEQG